MSDRTRRPFSPALQRVLRELDMPVPDRVWIVLARDELGREESRADMRVSDHSDGRIRSVSFERVEQRE